MSLEASLVLSAALGVAIGWVAGWIARGRREAALRQAGGNLANVPGDVMGEITGLLKTGRMINAIKAYRRWNGSGLAEAKDAVEQIARGMK